jgi:hypothetical protein
MTVLISEESILQVRRMYRGYRVEMAEITRSSSFKGAA